MRCSGQPMVDNVNTPNIEARHNREGSTSRWVKQDHGQLKLNCVAAIFSHIGSIGARL